MPDSTPRRKIAILGGGMGALTAAFHITAQPGWQERYDITLYQLGWRLGGKCATGRGPNGRIQEHGIHGFLGDYYNALKLMWDCYAELDRKPGDKLATFAEAFRPNNFVLLWEFRDHTWKPWPISTPTNDLRPTDGKEFATVWSWMVASVKILIGVVRLALEGPDNPWAHPLRAAVEALERVVGATPAAAARPSMAAISAIEIAKAAIGALTAIRGEMSDDIRRLRIAIDYELALLRGTLAAIIEGKSFKDLDEENFSDWLRRHGADAATVSAPIALDTPNLSYQYPNGDTSRPPAMGAGSYLQWRLRAFAYLGSFIWEFAAGTGDTAIAPLYLVLAKRGVTFRFFSKVTDLALAPDGKSVATVTIERQATLKDPAKGYQPLDDVNGLACWPAEPLYDQLVEGETMREAGVDLESWWTSWQPVATETLEAGRDFDTLVFGISIGAIPYLCKSLMEASPAWRDTVAHVPTVQTQAMQIWLKRSVSELGWTVPMAKGDNIISPNFLNPPSGHADLSFLIDAEAWTGEKPRSLIYICGPMADYGPLPPFDDPLYPRLQSERVKYQSIQYLQAGIGVLLPGATTNAVNPPGDYMGLDFSLLVCPQDDPSLIGVRRFDRQWWKANIDPSERYVTSPPGSTKYRLQADQRGIFANLVLAGDWIDTGLNVGSFEGAVMGGMLAAHAVCESPALDDIIGYGVMR